MSELLIEIKDSFGVWQPLSSGEVQSISDGSSSPDLPINDFTATLSGYLFADMPDIDPSIDPDAARLRITETAADESTITTYYMIEKKPGRVENVLDFATISGRAWCGIITRFRPLSFRWQSDALCSVLAAQVAHRDFDGQAGTTVPVDWLATVDAVIPGNRFEVSRMQRLDIIKKLAWSCGAFVRQSLDGLRFEVVDLPAFNNLPTAVHLFADPETLSYSRELVDEPRNAYRVRGLVPDYTGQNLPSIEVSLAPRSIAADSGTSTSTASAQVLDRNSNPVQHVAIIEEAITGSSNISIPVSNCFSVQAVFLNTGTPAAPVKGIRIEPDTFTASDITVPDNSTDEFIVSYTQATQVSWQSVDVADTIEGEAQDSIGVLAVSTTNNLGRVSGVYRATDTRRIGTNYFTGGSFTSNTKDITLGISPGPSGTALIIDYEIYNGAPLGLNVSPSSSLCDADGIAQTIIGSGSAVGAGTIEAAALDVTGEAIITLVGNAIDGLSVTVDPGILRAAQADSFGNTAINGEVSALEAGTEPGEDWFFTVDNTVGFVIPSGVSIAGLTPERVSWTGTKIIVVPFFNHTYTPGAAVAVNYTAIGEVTVPDSTAEIVATVVDSAGDPVADNTPVFFKIESNLNGGASLSANREVTSGGEASVTLTAGAVAKFYIVVSVGPLMQRVLIEVQADPTNQVAIEKLSNQQQLVSDLDAIIKAGETGEGTDPGEDSYNAANGAASGCRLLKGCDGPLIGAQVSTDMPGAGRFTDFDGIWCFNGTPPGTYKIMVNGIEKSLSIGPGGG